MKIFGREYNELGTDDKDLILKTRGKIKVKAGNKYIDLVDTDSLSSIELIIKRLEKIEKALGI